MKYLYLFIVSIATLQLASAQTTPTPTPAQTVTLSWNPSPDPTVVGYNLFTGTATKAYTITKDVGNTTTTTVPITQTNFFAVTAYNSVRLQSATSNEVTVGIPPAPTGLQIIRTNVATANRAATISWVTSGDSTGKVYIYNKMPGNPIDFRMAKTVTANHSVKFNGLKRGKTYFYQIVVRTPTGGAGPLSTPAQFSL